MRAPAHNLTAKAATALLAVSLLLHSGINAAAEPFEFNAGQLPEAAGMIKAMQAVHVTAHQLVIESKRWHHRVVVFVYPSKSKKVWVWDSVAKSREVKADAANPVAVATAWLRQMGIGDKVVNASFDDPLATLDHRENSSQR
ncbi:MAG TPA: hypothetical protein VMH83_04205 [Candidatus Acidoferrum sp.]|nr:hypothetical protein [Candidatus Acidoferrum sp.]